MSKQSLLTLANFNLFRNTNQEIEFSISKDNRVQAQYSGYDKAKGFDVRGIKARSSAGVGYIRLSIGMSDANGQREFHNGALFVNDKKTTDKQPDFQGSVNLDNSKDGPKLRLSAWKKTGEKAGPYLSISIQEFQVKDQPAAQDAKAPTAQDDFDMNDEAPAPAATRAPAQVAQRPAPTPQGRPVVRAPVAQPAGRFDDMDDDIPF
jgi:uncharacterized protein (DUF736 family)